MSSSIYAPRLELVAPDPFANMHVVAMHLLDVFMLHGVRLLVARRKRKSTRTGTPREYLPHIPRGVDIDCVGRKQVVNHGQPNGNGSGRLKGPIDVA